MAREFYVMQGEIYTGEPFGKHGSQEFSVEKLLDEHPEYFVFNGSVGAISKLHPLGANVGETVRIFSVWGDRTLPPPFMSSERFLTRFTSWAAWKVPLFREFKPSLSRRAARPSLNSRCKFPATTHWSIMRWREPRRDWWVFCMSRDQPIQTSKMGK